jgi:hypothetical protein
MSGRGINPLAELKGLVQKGRGSSPVGSPTAAAAAAASSGAAALASAASLTRSPGGRAVGFDRQGRTEYQVQVEIIEVRDLKTDDVKSNTCDPVVFIEIGEMKQHTAIVKKSTSATFNQLFFFSLQLTAAEFETGKVAISVFDACTFRDKLLGMCGRGG